MIDDHLTMADDPQIEARFIGALESHGEILVPAAGNFPAGLTGLPASRWCR
jgi:hypothetical protein